MLRRVEFKKRGKNAFYRNWKACVAVCFIYVILVGGTIISFNKSYNIDYNDNIPSVNINRIDADTNSDIVNEFLNGLNGNKQKNDSIFSATKGVIGTISNNVSKSGSYIFGILNALNQALFKDRIWASVIIIIGAILSLIYWVFVSEVLEVGEARFFIENRVYIKTKASKILIPYKFKNTLHIIGTMFLKNLYNILWFLTIIGGFIKHYSYLMVPYILAENPNMKARDVIKLSREMMDGYKWEMFKLDLSYVGWFFLGIITANIANLVFVPPYINATRAEVYMYLRDLAKTRGIKNSKKLNDKYLDKEITFTEYPVYEYKFKNIKTPKWLNINYKRDYSFWDIILLFFIIAIIGFSYEVILCLFTNGKLVNRGALYGPWLPIYGAGGIAMLVLLKHWRKNPLTYFILSMLLCGLIEYGTSVYLEIVHHMAWWDYTGFFLNINGRVCLEGLIVFGIGGLIVTYIAAPLFANILDKINKNIKMILSIILVIIIAFDFYASGKKPNSGDGVTLDVSESSKLDKFIK